MIESAALGVRSKTVRLLLHSSPWLILLGVLPAFLRADSTTVINEIFYHPATEAQTEWIELANTMSYDMDLSGWRLTGGVEYTFPPGTVIGTGKFLVVAADPSKVRVLSLFAEPLGPFQGRLSNGGESIELRDLSNRLMSWVDYDDEEPWPVGADGSGASLGKRRPGLNSAVAESWGASLRYGGTPGGRNFGTSRGTWINETAPAGGREAFWLELTTRDAARNLKDHVVAVAGDPRRQAFLPEIVVAGGGYTVVPAEELGFGVEGGDLLCLYSPNKAEVLDAVRVDEVVRGRSEAHPDSWLYPTETSPGAANPFAWSSAIVINEILYRPYPLPASPPTPPTFSRENVVEPGSTWRFWQGVPQQSDHWQQIDFDDAEWTQGGPLFGGGKVVFPEDSGQPTGITIGKAVYYFRLVFTVGEIGEGQTLQLQHLVDDGAVLYLNGEEIIRVNLPGGRVTPSTRATDPVENPEWSQVMVIPGDRLNVGANVIAAEVHQSSAFDQDVAFGAQVSLGRLLEPGIPAQPFRDAPGEWIELYNRGDEIVDMSGWSLDEAVRFDFPGGTQIQPHGYLVIANDREAVAAKYPELTGVLGNFDGSLANGGENILLRDANGNPADEVRYYDGGRWPEYADGGGSSLELRHPDADNAIAEAWAASDESSKAKWQDIGYRMVSGQTYGLNTWNELHIGMLTAGEVLIDDVKVIEDPDGAARQLMQNSGFNGSLFNPRGFTQRWRLLGNHRHSKAEPDPDDPGNSVLHIVASGPTDTKHNHLENTFAGNTKLKDGEPYEVRMRARWVAGSNRLNVRAYFGRLARTFELETPERPGTPGMANSQLVENVGPTYSGFTHAPLMPAAREAVTVSVEAGDAHGVDRLTLYYAKDGEDFLSVAMEESEGTFRALVPGMPRATVVHFYVEGRDALGAISRFPAAGPDSRALYVVDDGRGTALPLHEIRLIMKAADFDFLMDRLNLISNERLGCSVVVDEREIVYDTGVRLKGSPAGRARDGPLYQAFNIAFPPEQYYRGVHATVSIDRSGRTPRPGGQDEIYVKHLFNRAGLPAMFDDLGYFISPTGTHTGPALLSMARYGRLFTNTQFEDGHLGSVFNLEITYDPTTTTGGRESVKNPVPFSHGGRTDFRDLGDDKEQYRWALEMRTGRRADDYEGLIRFCQTMSLPKNQLARKIGEVMDMDQWMRAAAMHNLCGIGDTWWNAGLEHNMRIYVPRGGSGVVGLPWDLDFVFAAGVTSPIKSAGGNLRRVMDLPANTRLYYGHLLDLVDTVFNPEYMERWLSHYGKQAGQNFSSQLSYIRRRSNFARDRVTRDAPPVDFVITTNGGASMATEATSIDLSGEGWVNVRHIRLAGEEEPLDVTWTSGKSWKTTVPLVSGLNDVVLQAYDFQGALSGSQSITITSSARQATPFEHLRITELHYHPAEPAGAERQVSTNDDDFEFIELHNSSLGPLNLGGVSFVDGIEFVFPEGTILEGRGYAVLVRNRAAFEARYGKEIAVLGEYGSANLSNGGERVKLVHGSHGILTFQYRDDWAPETDGDGRSLVIVDPEAERASWNEATSWALSGVDHGSPGAPNAPVARGASSYGEWSQVFFPQGGTEAGAAADPDDDGLSNLLEYAFGLHPLVPESGAWPQIAVDAEGRLLIRYQRARGIADLSFDLEASPDLVRWESLGVDNASVTPGNEDVEVVTLRIVREESMRYARISVSL